MTSSLLQVGELAALMQHKPITLVRAVMDDPVTSAPDTRDALVLPNSVDVDLDKEGSDHAIALPHTMPSASAFSDYLGKKGITENTPLVVYDTRGIYSAPRVWWMLKSMGHSEAYLLDGGQPAWKTAGLPISETSQASQNTYQAIPQSNWFVDANTIVEALNSDVQIIDARSKPRFHGEIPEPREGLRSGHMPGAFNIPFTELLKNNHFLPVSDLKDVFDKVNIDLSKPIICTCGSGITACIIGYAALLCGATDVAVYDGSWSQWGANNQYPVVID